MENPFMAEAIRLAHEMMNKKEGGPFGAVVVREGRIIGRGWNRVTVSNDPTAHAEINAIREACRNIESFDLSGCDLYVNCEPCPMCLSAAYWAQIENIYYGATREDAEKIGFADNHIYKELGRANEHRQIRMHQMMRDQVLPVFAQWQEMDDKIEY